MLAYLEFSQFFSILVIVFFSWCRDGCNAFVQLFLLKELILINSFVLRVSSKVFNLSFCKFLSSSLWLIYYGKLWYFDNWYKAHLSFNVFMAEDQRVVGINSFLWIYGDLCIFIVIFSWCSFTISFFPWLGSTSHGFFKKCFCCYWGQW